LVRDGFTADSAIKAVMNGDMNLLEHTAMVSVQLQVPGTQPAPASNGNGQPQLPAPTP
jgi:hypothetical protein